jgi:hypothetical protein
MLSVLWHWFKSLFQYQTPRAYCYLVWTERNGDDAGAIPISIETFYGALAAMNATVGFDSYDVDKRGKAFFLKKNKVLHPDFDFTVEVCPDWGIFDSNITSLSVK